MNEEYIKLLQAGIDSQNAEQGTLNEFDCPICKNKGEIYYLDENYNECTKECKCMKKRRIIQNTRNIYLLFLMVLTKLNLIGDIS